MSQITCRTSSTTSTPRTKGKTIRRNLCKPLAPSSDAASSTSLGTCVSPAKLVNATNGTDCQVMMRVATKKKESGSMSQLCPMKFIPVTWVTTQLTTPDSVSNIQPQTTVAVSGGIAQASRRPAE